MDNSAANPLNAEASDLILGKLKGPRQNEVKPALVSNHTF